MTVSFLVLLIYNYTRKCYKEKPGEIIRKPVGNDKKPVETSENHRETGEKRPGNGGNDQEKHVLFYNLF